MVQPQQYILTTWSLASRFSITANINLNIECLLVMKCSSDSNWLLSNQGIHLLQSTPQTLLVGSCNATWINTMANRDPRVFGIWHLGNHDSISKLMSLITDSADQHCIPAATWPNIQAGTAIEPGRVPGVIYLVWLFTLSLFDGTNSLACPIHSMSYIFRTRPT